MQVMLSSSKQFRGSVNNDEGKLSVIYSKKKTENSDWKSYLKATQIVHKKQRILSEISKNSIYFYVHFSLRGRSSVAGVAAGLLAVLLELGSY